MDVNFTMKGQQVNIDHIGIAVKSLEAGIEQWEKVFGYRQMTQIITNTRQKVKVVFLSKKDSIDVKLIEPVDTSSPVYTFAQRGGGLHHLCFKCEDIGKEINRLQEMGLRVLAEPQPGEAFENENIAFIYAKQGLNIELIDTDKRAGRL
jgi:methylmalonyl-CoA/ethylmalonyl-CoA epimerase